MLNKTLTQKIFSVSVLIFLFFNASSLAATSPESAGEPNFSNRQTFLVQWNLRENPIRACRQKSLKDRSFIFKLNDACANFSYLSSGVSECAITTAKQTTHQEIGSLLAWCMTKYVPVSDHPVHK